MQNVLKITSKDKDKKGLKKNYLFIFQLNQLICFSLPASGNLSSSLWVHVRASVVKIGAKAPF